jgi:F0F1-type ATP synthase assembly protein I
MKKTEAPGLTPTPKRGGEKQKNDSYDPKAAFISAAFGMSWQLAVVVLIPVVGGFKLDEHLNTSPALTIVGFVVAMAGVFVILKRVLNEFGGTGQGAHKK